MNILYIHGFASEYDPKSAKVECLRKLGTVTGVTVDYTQGYDSVRAVILDAILSNSIDLVVGTSMGGYMASHVSAGIPFVALNPSVSPSASLSKYLGGFVDYSGKTGVLTDDAVSSYPDFSTTAVGLIL